MTNIIYLLIIQTLWAITLKILKKKKKTIKQSI